MGYYIPSGGYARPVNDDFDVAALISPLDSNIDVRNAANS
jgi:hypothetical protein